MAIGIHPSSEIEDDVEIGAGTRVWAMCQIRRGARIGADCVIGRNVFIDAGVTIGNRCKIQNNALLYAGVSLADGVFVGPAVCFTNDKLPRAIRPDGGLKHANDWTLGQIRVLEGASIGAQSVIVTGVTLGRFCLIGSGSVVTRDIGDFTLAVGQPARVIGYVCRCAGRLSIAKPTTSQTTQDYICSECGRGYRLEADRVLEHE